MTTHDALLQAVLANPKDDTVRKAYADFCRENWQTERADFIEVQIELEPIRYTTDVNQAFDLCRLRDLETDLWAKHAPIFAAGLPGRSPAYHAGCLVRSGMPTAIEYTFRRGFVSEVRCTLADWCGGGCEQCGGRRLAANRLARLEVEAANNVTDSDDVSGMAEALVGLFSPCPECNGTGRTPGIGPAIVRRHPVEKVVVSNREPFQGMSSDNAAAWGWCDNDTNYLLDCHIGGAWMHLPSEGQAKTASVWFRFYPTRELAIQSLSTALLSWAKSEHPNASQHHLV